MPLCLSRHKPGLCLQAATVICSVPTLLNIPPATLKRRLKLLAYGLLPWSTTAANLKPSVLGRLLTTPDARLMRLSYLAFLHGFATPQAAAADGQPGGGASVESVSAQPADSDCPDASGPAKRISLSLLENVKQEGSTSKGTTALAQAPGGKGIGGMVRSGGSAIQGQCRMHGAAGSSGQLLKAPLSFTIMPEGEFLTKYPRFTRWLRRKNRSLSVLSVRSL